MNLAIHVAALTAILAALSTTTAQADMTRKNPRIHADVAHAANQLSWGLVRPRPDHRRSTTTV
ncbi:MAG: hypothetical protein M0C28_17710 [Candidatus Moduliflexus flocculans]|nr:hypothetical protein [Candidatus Moduliflexus flocculans]